MIVKKVPNPDKTATKRVRITRLLEYIRAPERDDATEKCIHYGTRSFASDDPADQIAEMVAVAKTARRSRDPTNHYVASWPAGEQPTPAQVDEAIDIFRQQLAIPDLLVAYALHADTENWHAHIVVLRVDPETGKPVQIQKGFDLDAAQRAGALIEHKQGWRVTPNKRWAVIDGRVVPTDPNPKKPDRPRPKEPHERRKPPQRQRDMALRARTPSVTQRAIDIVAPMLDTDLPSGWEAFHAALDEHRMTYSLRGGGAVFKLDGVTIKASAVDRRATLPRLEARFGAPYQDRDPARTPPPTAREVEKRAAAQVKARIQPLIEKPPVKWDAMHTGLADLEHQLVRVGGGLRIRSAKHDVAASHVHRGFSLSALEQQLGTYEPAAPDVAPLPKPPPAPAPQLPPVPELPDPAGAGPLIAACNSWKDIHTTLPPAGYWYERYRSGAVIRAGPVTVKASEVSRKATLGALERRFGAAYEPPEPGLEWRPDAATPAPPVAADPDWQAYEDEREQQRVAKAAARIADQQQYALDLAALKRKQQTQRKDELDGDWTDNGHALNERRRTLRLLHDAQTAALRNERRKAAEERRRRYPPWPDFRTWKQDSWIVPGDPGGPPAPAADIRDYTARVIPNGVAYCHRDRQTRPDFVDTGSLIRFRPPYDIAAFRAATQILVAKGRRGVRIRSRSPEFIRLSIQAAVEQGLAVSNPELQEQVAAEHRRQAAEAGAPALLRVAYLGSSDSDYAGLQQLAAGDPRLVIERPASPDPVTLASFDVVLLGHLDPKADAAALHAYSQLEATGTKVALLSSAAWFHRPGHLTVYGPDRDIEHRYGLGTSGRRLWYETDQVLLNSEKRQAYDSSAGHGAVWIPLGAPSPPSFPATSLLPEHLRDEQRRRRTLDKLHTVLAKAGPATAVGLDAYRDRHGIAPQEAGAERGPER